MGARPNTTNDSDSNSRRNKYRGCIARVIDDLAAWWRMCLCTGVRESEARTLRLWPLSFAGTGEIFR